MSRFTRRQFMGTTAAGALALAAPNTFAAGPKKGGSLRVAMAHGNTVDNYDPAVWDNAFMQFFMYSRNAYLTEIMPDGSLRGEIAESWDASPDASVWTLHLRKGVEFHNGKSLTPEDVITSLRYHQGEETKSAAKPVVAPITDMKADGPNKVVLTLDGGNADLPFVLSDYHLAIVPSKDGKIDIKDAASSGPYQVESFEPGVRAILKRYPNYFRDDVAFVDDGEIISVVDPAARQNALITGEVDVIDQVDLKTVHLLKRSKGVKVVATNGTQHYTFAMDTRVAPFDDNNVRMALKFAIDRKELVDKILNGYGAVGNDHPIGRSNRYFAKELPQREYDADKARYYLKQAGMDKLEVSLSAADAAFGGAVDAATLYSETAAKAGITLNVVREPNDGYWSNVWMKKPWSAVYWGGRPTEDWMFSTAYSAGAAWNDTFWDNKRFNELLVTARSELDDAKRRAMYVEMQTLVSNDCGAVIPMFASYVMGFSEKVGHGEMAANWTMDGNRGMQRWWKT